MKYRPMTEEEFSALKQGDLVVVRKHEISIPMRVVMGPRTKFRDALLANMDGMSFKWEPSPDVFGREDLIVEVEPEDLMVKIGQGEDRSIDPLADLLSQSWERP